MDYNLVVEHTPVVVEVGRTLAVDYSHTAVAVAVAVGRTLNYSQAAYSSVAVAEIHLIEIVMLGQVQLSRHSWGRMSRYRESSVRRLHKLSWFSVSFIVLLFAFLSPGLQTTVG
jgi:hypothetical protein